MQLTWQTGTETRLEAGKYTKIGLANYVPNLAQKVVPESLGTESTSFVSTARDTDEGSSMYVAVLQWEFINEQ